MELEVSYSSTRKGVSDRRTSSTREGKEMQDNVLGGSIGSKKDHERGPRWREEASYKGYTFLYCIECTATTLSAVL